ncbi:MAG: spore coat polysaccharide synthesis [Oscillospiraceae bacterium]|nr:spore coat polysaccharide synthesis [Oscillospiraceae bacterium]
MALYNILQADFLCSDLRGQLVQLVHNGYQQINILESRKGAVRGGHYHKISKEAFFVVSGSVDVAFKRGEEQEIVRFLKNDFFLIEPYTIHRMSFCEDCVLIALYDVPIEKEDGTKDIYSEEIDNA